jgi:hypothetical protein
VRERALRRLRLGEILEIVVTWVLLICTHVVRFALHPPSLSEEKNNNCEKEKNNPHPSQKKKAENKQNNPEHALHVYMFDINLRFKCARQ